MIDRVLILLAVALLILAGWAGLRVWRALRLRQLQAQSPLGDLVPIGKPGVVAFSAPYCHECRTRQAPALARLQSALRDRIAVTSVSALDRPDLVEKLGILTVPATVVIDARGRPIHFTQNYGRQRELVKKWRWTLGG